MKIIHYTYFFFSDENSSFSIQIVFKIHSKKRKFVIFIFYNLKMYSIKLNIKQDKNL